MVFDAHLIQDIASCSNRLSCSWFANNIFEKDHGDTESRSFLIAFLRVSATPWLWFSACGETHLHTFSAPQWLVLLLD
jgi:hypothetical protein